MTAIGDWAFFNCHAMKSIVLPDSLAGLGELAFNACSSLEEIILDSEHPYLGFENGILFTKADRKLLFYAYSDAETCTVPEGIRIIGTKAFRNGDRLREIILPGSVEKIESGAFENCGQVGKIVFSPGLEEIAPSGLSGLSGLEEIVLPEGLKIIGDEAFSCCENLKSVLIPDSVTEIGEDTINLVVYAEEGSAAAEYCREHSLLTAGPGQEAPQRTAELPSAFAEAYAGYAGLYEIENTGDEAVYLTRTAEGALVLLCGRLR